MIRAEQQGRLEEAIGNKYQLLCRIGGGGMAQVYLARHRVHGGLFAIKVLAEHLAQDPSIVGRFEQEARMAASLAAHPNIVPIFDIGEGAGLHYLVMQFIAGEDLCSLTTREGRLTPVVAANVVAQAAEALSCAEAKRIVHRDLKLANMLLDEGGRVKLLDFGISKITDIADGLTRPGESLGTPYYMSPEQIRGEGCDIRSDLYSLGVVFFELLAGRRPFENESATAIQIAHLSTPPPSLLALDPALPPACDTIVQKLLAKKPADRYQNTAELLADLFAHGATAGPGTLRPRMAPALLAAIAEAPQLVSSLPAQSLREQGRGAGSRDAAGPQKAAQAAWQGELTAVATPPPSAVAVPQEYAAGELTAQIPERPQRPLPQPAVVPAMVERPVAVASGVAKEAEPQADLNTGESPRPRGFLVAVVSLVLLLAAAGGGFMMLRSKQTPPATQTASAAKAALPAVLADPNGRMLLVPAGVFVSGRPAGTAGSTPGDPSEQITLPAFYIDETEVSNGEYRRFCRATGHAEPKMPGYQKATDEPVTGVSWDDAAAYARWAGKRLPTKQEWEKAARGTDGRSFPWGSEPWTSGVPVHLEPVRAEPDRRSPYGAYNMAGNAWEWTASRDDAGQREFDDMHRLLGSDNFSREWYTIKGGSFSPGGSAGFASYLRRGFPSDGKSPWIGFRCARNAPSQ